MRKLAWFTGGFAASCGLLTYRSETPGTLLTAMTVTLAGLAMLVICRKRNILRPGIGFLCGILAGSIWFGGYHHIYLRPLNQLEGQSVILTVTASDEGYDTGWGTGVDGVAVIEGKPYQIRAYIDGMQEISPGDILQGAFRLRLTAGEEGSAPYFQGKGVFLLAYQQEEIHITKTSQIPLWCFPAVLRHQILRMLDDTFLDDTAPFVKALLLGDTHDLDYKTDTALKISGIRHIVAVSGLHVSILYGAISAITMKRRFLTALVGLPILVLFAAMAGFTPSVMRACLMVGLMMLAAVLNREYDSPTALAFAVLILLLLNPLSVSSASLQLSVGCVAGILMFNEPIQQWLKSKIPGKGRLNTFACSGVSVTLSSMSLITPLSAWYFGSVSLVSVMTNLLTLWVVTFIFVGAMMTCILWLMAPGAAVFLAGLLSWPVRYVLAAADKLASFPMSAVYTQSVYIMFWLVFIYLLLIVFLTMKRKKPVVLLCCAVLGLCFALTASWLEPLTGDTRITMLDVGQGQSILLQTQGRTFLVDCGGDDDGETADLIAETLLSQGIARLDGIILTHYDRDHSGGIHDLLTRVDTEYLFLPDTYHEIPIPQTTGKTVWVWEDLELTVGTAKLQIFGPVYSGQSNENSLCVLFDTENCDILVTGDRSAFGERMLMRRRRLPDVDILVAGHHGAAEATSEELLLQTKPETVLISVGQDNIYGQPAPALLQRLEAFGCTVRRTDENGTITIRR